MYYLFALLITILVKNEGCQNYPSKQDLQKNIVVIIHVKDRSYVKIHIFNNTNQRLKMPCYFTFGYEDDNTVDISFQIETYYQNKWKKFNLKDVHYNFIPNQDVVYLNSHTELIEEFNLNNYYQLKESKYYKIRVIFRYENKEYYSNWVLLKKIR